MTAPHYEADQVTVWHGDCIDIMRSLPDASVDATVKPLDLMRWLVRLVTPPGGTVLEPFAGTTLIASRPGQPRVDERTGEIHEQPAVQPRFDPVTWEDRIANALGVLDDLRAVYRDARAAGVLEQKLTNGETVGDVVLGLARRLEQDQATEAGS